jgi:hypothetical protein
LIWVNDLFSHHSLDERFGARKNTSAYFGDRKTTRCIANSCACNDCQTPGDLPWAIKYFAADI